MRKLLSLIFICATITSILGCTQETEDSTVESAVLMRSMSVTNNTEENTEEGKDKNEEFVDRPLGSITEEFDLNAGTDVKADAVEYNVKCDYILDDSTYNNYVDFLSVYYKGNDNVVKEAILIGYRPGWEESINACKIVGFYTVYNDICKMRKLNYDIQSTDTTIHLNTLDFIQEKNCKTDSR